MREVDFQDLGSMDYKACWDFQEKLFHAVIQTKMDNRKLERSDTPSNHLLFVEHPHVYTLGKSGEEENLLATPESLLEQQATFYKINRGGDITYHGPGQIVGYPIFDLDQFFTDIHKYLRYLEEAIILTLAEYGIKGERYPGYTGVWLDAEDPLRARKIAALGVKCSRWVTMHGFAFNINTDLLYFNNIVPCGIDDKQVTSMQKELRKEMDMNEVKGKLLTNLANLFDFDIRAKKEI